MPFLKSFVLEENYVVFFSAWTTSGLFNRNRIILLYCSLVWKSYHGRLNRLDRLAYLANKILWVSQTWLREVHRIYSGRSEPSCFDHRCKKEFKLLPSGILARRTKNNCRLLLYSWNSLFISSSISTVMFPFAHEHVPAPYTSSKKSNYSAYSFQIVM